MDSIFLAKVIGIVMVVLGFSFLFNLSFIKKAVPTLLKNTEVMYMMRVYTLIIGTLMILGHNEWDGWPVVITVIAWLVFLKGALFVLFPDKVTEFASKNMKAYEGLFMPLAIVVLGVGAYLVYQGFELAL